MWKKLKKRKIQRLLKGSFPPYWGEFFFQTPKKNQKGLIASLCYAPTQRQIRTWKDKYAALNKAVDDYLSSFEALKKTTD